MNIYVLIFIFMTCWKCRWEKRGLNTKINMQYLYLHGLKSFLSALAPTALPPLAFSVYWQDTAFQTTVPCPWMRPSSRRGRQGSEHHYTFWEEPAEYSGALGWNRHTPAQKLILSYSNCTLNLNLARWPQASTIRGQLQLLHIEHIRVQLVPPYPQFHFPRFQLPAVKSSLKTWNWKLLD